MEKLTTFQFNNTRKLFELAKKLNNKKFFDVFLNEAQYKIVNYILLLDNFDIWYHFLEGNCLLKFKKVEGEVEVENQERNGEKEEEKDKEIDEGKDEEEPEDEELGEDQEKEEEIEEKVEENGEKSIVDEGNQENSENTDSHKDLKDTQNELKEEDTDIETSSENEILFDEGVKMIKMLALHIRYLLWEKAIDYYYNSKALNSSLNEVDEISDNFELIDTLDEESDHEELIEVVKEVKVRDEEDDYDMDDEDDDEEEKEKDEQKDEVTKDISKDPEPNNFDPVTEVLLLEIPSTIFTTSPKPQETQPTESKDTSLISESIIEDQENLIKEFNKVYHNFEYDRETLLKRRKLEQSDLQLEDSKEPQTDDGDEDDDKFDDIDKNMTITLGAASTSLQHLLTTIQQKREEVPLNDFELRTLFMDVRKNRGKWANDDRVGQEELYEACEKVVLELRGYTEHSTPFLNKVSKREAPNYGLIIKKPMDLNTVMKKLKVLSYNSKQEFVDDIMLIWSNCLAYNADPKHFLRAHALAMQKKAFKLVPIIPDIVIRSRTDIEKEEDDDKGTPIGGGKSMKKGRKRTRQDQVKVEDTPATPGLDSEVEEIEEEPEVEVKVESNHEEEDSEQMEEKPEEPENEEEINQTQLLNELDEEFDPELQAWRSITAKSRANYCSHRSELFDSHNHLRPDAKAILRQSREMDNFNHYLNNTEVISKNSNLLENDELYLLEYDITGGIPGIVYRGIDKEEEDRRENLLVDKFLQEANGDASKISSLFVLPIDSGLNKIYTENITEIQEIRKICFKISLIRQMQTQQFVHHTQMKQPVIEVVKEVDIDDVSKLSNHDSFDKDVQFAVLRRNMCKVAMQTGFESTEPTAINTLTQLAERYLGNLIKSLKLHTESNSSNELSAREILLLSLLENGVDKPDDLYTYVQEKVLKQHHKLKDLRSKLSNFLKELLRPGLKNFNERSFEDNSEQFMTGDFSNDLGDDFFGFKELGLDKEFKMLTSSIPIYLLHSKLHKSYSNTGVDTKRNKYEDMKDYEPKHLRASDIDQQIGILKHFYTKLYDKSKLHYIKMQKKKGESTELPENNSLVLIEDEELPQKQRNIRPRLPPTGKIGGVKKKIVANGFFLADEE